MSIPDCNFSIFSIQTNRVLDDICLFNFYIIVGELPAYSKNTFRNPYVVSRCICLACANPITNADG